MFYVMFIECILFFFKQKTAYELRISDWSSDVCSSDLYSATIDYDFGAATLTSATTYSKTQSRQLQDASYAFGVLFPLLTEGAIPPGITPFSLDLGLKKWTQEVRLASPSGGRFEWLVEIGRAHV